MLPIESPFSVKSSNPALGDVSPQRVYLIQNPLTLTSQVRVPSRPAIPQGITHQPARLHTPR
jgi:hypothetical protein